MVVLLIEIEQKIRIRLILILATEGKIYETLLGYGVQRLRKVHTRYRDFVEVVEKWSM